MTSPAWSEVANAPVRLAPRRAVAVAFLVLGGALGAACGGSLTVAGAPGESAESVDPDVERMALPDDLAVSGVLVDDQGCVVNASACVSGAGTVPSVGTGASCAAAATAAAISAVAALLTAQPLA